MTAAGPAPVFRVAHVLTRPELGGAQLNTLHTVRGLDRSRFAPMVITSPDGPLAADFVASAGVRTVLVPELVREVRPLLDARAALRLVTIFRRERPHLVHTHSSKAGILGRIAARAAGVPIVVHSVHGFAFHDHQPAAARTAYRAIEWLAAAATDRFLCVSRADLDQGEAAGLFRRASATLVRSGVAVEDFRDHGGRGAALRRELEVEPEAPLIGMVACLKPQKDPLAFVRAAAAIAARVPAARFVLVGDGVLRSEVERLRASLGLERRLLLLGWRRDVAAVMNALDVLVLTSLHEGLPRVVLEAMAAGKPVVATAVDGTPEAVSDGVNGRLVPPRDAAAAAAAVIEILDQPELAHRMGEQGRRLAADFDIARLVPEQEAIYLELLERAGLMAPHGARRRGRRRRARSAVVGSGDPDECRP